MIIFQNIYYLICIEVAAVFDCWEKKIEWMLVFMLIAYGWFCLILKFFSWLWSTRKISSTKLSTYGKNRQKYPLHLQLFSSRPFAAKIYNCMKFSSVPEVKNKFNNYVEYGEYWCPWQLQCADIFQCCWFCTDVNRFPVLNAVVEQSLDPHRSNCSSTFSMRREKKGKNFQDTKGFC